MRISILGPSYPYRGGIVLVNTRLVETLQKMHGDDVQVFTWKRLYPSILLPKPESEFKDSVSKDHYEIQNALDYVDYLNPISHIRLVRDVKKHKSEYFITHWQQPVQFPVYLFIFLLLKIFTRTKLTLIAHNVKQHEASWISNTLTVILFRLADRVVAHSKEEAAEAERLAPKTEVISSYLPLHDLYSNYDQKPGELRKQLNISPDQKVLLFFGFIRPYKGLEYLIKAMPRILEHYPDLKLLIVGELFWKGRTDKKSLKDRILALPFRILSRFVITNKAPIDEYNPLTLVDELGLADSIHVVDTYVPNEDVPKYFLDSDALVAPYLSASQTGPTQIAYTYDKPVLASNVGGLVESVEDGVSGFKFEPANPDEIVEAVVKFYESKDIDWEKEVAQYKKRFFWEPYVDKLLG